MGDLRLFSRRFFLSMKISKIQVDENKVSKKVTECRQKKTKNDPLRLKYKKNQWDSFGERKCFQTKVVECRKTQKGPVDSFQGLASKDIQS